MAHVSWEHKLVGYLKECNRALRTREFVEHFVKGEKLYIGGNVRTGLSTLKTKGIIVRIKVGKNNYYVHPNWIEEGKIKEEYKPNDEQITFNQYWGKK